MTDKFIDIIASNLIILITYSATLITCNIFLSDLNYFLYFNLPFGILILGFLFFGNKIIFGLIIGHLIYYILLQNFNLNLYFRNYLVISIFYISCVPITLLVLNNLKINIGMGLNYKLNKGNIYHVILITLFSSITFFFQILFFSLFYELDINIYFHCFGNFIGGSLLILMLKLTVKLASYFKILSNFLNFKI